MKQIYKTIMSVLIILMLASTIVYAQGQTNVKDSTDSTDSTPINTDDKISKEETNQIKSDKLDKIYAKNLSIQETTVREANAITGYPPSDSNSLRLSSNTNSIFMKVDYIPQTDWVDIVGYYSQSNYFQLPINVKLVNGTNSPLKYKNIYEYIYEYKDNGWGNYQYIRTYSKTVNTGSTGNAESLFSLPFRGYSKSMYIVIIEYSDVNGNYVSYRKNTHAAWYIN